MTEGKLPENWKTTEIIPLLKTGKKPENPDFYTPVALTSALSKVMEKVMARRIVWTLKRGISGFRAKRWVSDAMARLDYFIKNA